MKTSRNPFSLYDLLGYLIPGLLALYGLNIFLEGGDFSISHYIELCNTILKADLQGFGNIVSLIVVAYLLGHILSYLSAMLIEKFSIWSIDYPTKYLLSEGYLQEFHESNNSLSFLRKFFTTRGRLSFFIFFLRTLMLIFLIPILIPLIIFSLVFNVQRSIRKSLDRKLADIIYEKVIIFLATLNIQLNKKDIGNFEWFRIVEHHVIENLPNHAPKMDNYVALYGFNRNITLMFVFFFWIHSFISIENGSIRKEWLFLCCLSLLSFIFYAAFNKFFRRYSLEVLMAVVSNPGGGKLEAK